MRLDAVRAQRRRETALEIAHFVVEGLAVAADAEARPKEDATAHAVTLEAEYARAPRALEAAHRVRVQRIHGHRELEAHGAALELLDQDLFDEGTWLAFGSSSDRVRRGDRWGGDGWRDRRLGWGRFVPGRHRPRRGLGGVLGWFGAVRLAELSVVDRPLGGRLARFGPSKNPNFPFVLLGRARFHGALVAARTHARRDVMELPGRAKAARCPGSGTAARARVRLRRAPEARAGSPRYRAAIDELTGIVDAILREDERRPLA